MGGRSMKATRTALLLALLLLLGELFVNVGIVARTTVAEREVPHLALDVVETKAMCQRSIEIIGFTRNLHLLVGAHAVERAHVVQAVGQFDEQRTDIVVQRVEHLLVVVNLAR